MNKTLNKNLSKTTLAISVANLANNSEGLSRLKTSEKNDYDCIKGDVEFEHRLHYDRDFIDDSFDSLEDISETVSISYESLLVYK